MKELKGKCKKCFGCNRLNDKNFEGVKKCKYYVGMGVEKETLIAIILGTILILICIILIIIACIKFNMLCGN